MKKQIRSGSVRVRLSLTEVLYNVCIASDGYRTVFLQSPGISASYIGIITALSTTANIIAPPIWGAISDKVRSSRICFVLCLALSSLLLAMVPFAARFGTPLYLGVIVCLATASLFSGPANTMMEQWLVRIDNSPLGISYGSIRMWASLGYAAMGIAYTRILQHLPVASVYVFYFLFAIPAILLALTIPDIHAPGTEHAPKIRFRDMPFRNILNFWIVVYLIYTVVSSVPSITYSNSWPITPAPAWLTAGWNAAPITSPFPSTAAAARLPAGIPFWPSTMVNTGRISPTWMR